MRAPRLGLSIKLAERVAEVAECFGVVWVQPDCFLVITDRTSVLTDLL
jgi:hypothetical protein